MTSTIELKARYLKYLDEILNPSHGTLHMKCTMMPLLILMDQQGYKY